MIRMPTMRKHTGGTGDVRSRAAAKRSAGPTGIGIARSRQRSDLEQAPPAAKDSGPKPADFARRFVAAVNQAHVGLLFDLFADDVTIADSRRWPWATSPGTVITGIDDVLDHVSKTLGQHPELRLALVYSQPCHRGVRISYRSNLADGPIVETVEFDDAGKARLIT